QIDWAHSVASTFPASAGIGETSISCSKSKQKGISMKRIRNSLATIALLATLVGPFLQGIGLGSLANTASSRHASSPFVVGQSTKSVAFVHKGPCPWAGSDC